MSHSTALRHRHLAAASGVNVDVLYSAISAGMLLVRRYLTGRGVDQAFADRYGSAYGRTAAKLYRDEHDGAEPRKAWSNVNGKWRRVNGFLPGDAPVLEKAFVTYKRTAEYAAPAVEPVAVDGPVEVYVKATAGYAARFEGLTGDALRRVEEQRDTSAVSDHMQGLLNVLADWKRHVDRFEATVTEADEQRLAALSWDDPRVTAWRTASGGMGAYLQARSAANAAYVDWSFDLTGSPDLDAEPVPAEPEPAADCGMVGCDGFFHDQGTHVAPLGELKLTGEGGISVELVGYEGGEQHVTVYSFDLPMDATHLRSSDPAELHALADRFHAFGDAVDTGAWRLSAGV